MQPTTESRNREQVVDSALISLESTLQNCEIDTLKVGFPMDCLHVGADVLESAFVRQITRGSDASNGQETVSYRLAPEHVKSQIGLAELQLRPERNLATLRISSKVLKGDYSRGICSDTIEQALNASLPRYLPLDVPAVVDASVVHEVHVATNYPAEPLTTIWTLSRANYDKKRFASTVYGKGAFTGIEWRSILKVSTLKLHAYDKAVELSRRPEEYALLNGDSFLDSTRLEVQLRKHADIRDAYQIDQKGPPTLRDVLGSGKARRALLNSYDKVIMKESTKPMPIVGSSWREQSRYAGYLWFYEYLNGDPRWIEAYIRSQYPRGTNVTRYVNEAKEMFRLIASQNFEGEQAEKDAIERIRDFLKTGVLTVQIRAVNMEHAS